LAIESVLKQRFDDFEIIVVDDGSEDNTAQVLEAFRGRIRYLKQTNRGVGAARNAGIRAATGQWVAFLDSDDEWLDTYFADLNGLIQRHPRAVGIVLDASAISADMQEHTYFSEFKLAALFGEKTELFIESPFSTVVAHNIVTIQSSAFLRATLSQTRLFDESLKMAEDLDLIAEMALRGPYVLSTSLAARVVRRQGDIECLSHRLSRTEVRMAFSGVYERFLRNPQLVANDSAALRERYASNQRALGNLHLKQGSVLEARAAYRSAWLMHRSFASIFRWLCTFLPQGIARKLLHKDEGGDPSAKRRQNALQENKSSSESLTQRT